ncbi:MAG: hypothetical protein RJQ09_02685 [Cyclobacteriaceae bacterium]
MEQYDLVIAYRVYPGVSKSPPIYSDDKLKLTELCLKSFARALQGFRVFIKVFLDGCPKTYNALFAKTLNGYDFEFEELDCLGNLETFQLQLEYLSNQKKSEYVFFAEDDYFYLKNSFSCMLEAIKLRDIDFITPYNHPDVHNHSLHSYKKSEFMLGGIKWIESASTTLTFLTSVNILKETNEVFGSYLGGNNDASIWFTLTKKPIFDVLNFRFKKLDRLIIKVWMKKYFHNLVVSIFGKKYTLIQPSLSLATHMESSLLPPEVDWNKEFNLLIPKNDATNN